MSKLIVANWKMYLTPNKSAALTKKIKDHDLALCPSFDSLREVGKLIKGKKKIHLCAQNVSGEKNGAYTGEVGVDDLCQMGVKYVIVGHSERRINLNETDEMINKKLKIVLGSGLSAILCAGEPMAIRKKGQQKQYIRKQILSAVKGIKNIKKLIIAYEPVWAISGQRSKSDSVEDISEMHEYIKGLLKVKVLYGGSVNSRNAATLLKNKKIDGLLVGSASTKFSELSKIINIAK